MKQNICIILQARMGSTRFRGKVLKKIMGKPVLEYQIERLRRIKRVSRIIVACTRLSADQPIVALCRRLNIPCFRGPVNDVLTRFYRAAVLYSADVIVRMTGDCPLVDPRVADRVITFYLKYRRRYDYVANTLVRTYPRGVNCEIFSFSALKRAARDAKNPADREHVTAYIRRHPRKFRLANLKYHKDLSYFRWTLDTPDDFKLIKRIFEWLYPQKRFFSWKDCVMLMQDHPEWRKINAHIRQKEA